MRFLLLPILFTLSACHYSLHEAARGDYAAPSTCTKQRYDLAQLDNLPLWEDPEHGVNRLVLRWTSYLFVATVSALFEL